jgi:hypothetical protein
MRLPRMVPHELHRSRPLKKQTLTLMAEPVEHVRQPMTHARNPSRSSIAKGHF